MCQLDDDRGSRGLRLAHDCTNLVSTLLSNWSIDRFSFTRGSYLADRDRSTPIGLGWLQATQGEIRNGAKEAAINGVPNVNDEELRRRIAEAAYYRAQGRGFRGDHQLDDWLAAEREFASLTSAEPESQSEDSLPPQPDQSSGAAIPAPLAKEERIRAEEIKQSARELSVATEAQKAQKTDQQPAPKKARKRASDGKASEVRRSV